MTHLRSLRKKKIGGSIGPAPQKKEPEPEITGKGSKKTAWVKHYVEPFHFLINVSMDLTVNSDMMAKIVCKFIIFILKERFSPYQNRKSAGNEE